MTYNSLRFSASDASRAQYMQKVIDYIDPDIVALQEIEDQGGIDLLLNQVFNTGSQAIHIPSDYAHRFIHRLDLHQSTFLSSTN